ncbi:MULTISPECIES: methyl-accepting chemotaxis protein [Aliivibrio]|uniref:Methyl-accepting chemotaxis protein n=1 Tax=Aliivibrio finisterrensis TaxID=511998 RepID=A0A4Q5KF61_9GAMM|nr:MULTISPECIES: methyl-accepting chemotaxis protein [Aliivibrio]MDD9180033.1 methyl-accepting chemotaxis protein [Aliivibrio sp. A6]RYU43685.1 methyl-accepting chemotaxis protein [Aliivibrio finisterrensis]RYU52413.1 methyl-accepting chemotaxis protein [Aliivibrio finisterrensis]RYU55015.1 methyl-accepting chemotaxis protein [Aliivibrio finisterrensis]RYU58049.1 methyl-accepting chemotaxis protein [Aliivibrio finisterrensis]
MFKNLSLKNKLAISASAAIILGGVLVEALSFKASLDRLDTEVEQRLESTTASYNQYVTDWILSKERALTSLPTEAKNDAIVTHLKQIRDSAKFDNVFLAYPDGSQANANGVILPPGNDDPRKWGWYINALAAPSKVFMDNPTVAAATGANVVSLGKALNLHGQQMVLGADVEITDILNSMEKVIFPGDGFMFIANDKGNIFTHPNTKLLNKSVSTLGLDFSTIQQATNSNSDISIELDGEKYIMYAQKIDGTSLITVSVINYDSLVAPLFDAVSGQVLVTAIVVIICTLLFNLLCNILFRPLNNVSQALAQIANGSGDLTQRIHIENNDEVGKLANNFNIFVESLQQLIQHIRQQSQQLTAGSEQSTNRANNSVKELNLQQQEITMVATAVTEMASATREIASHAEQTAEAAQNSSSSTQKGQSLVIETKTSISNLANEVNEASTVISDLQQHSQEINTVLATIQGIAEQTNLLALNAAIEAARAGEQGRGFAVVADEVRVLSQRTHTSTEEIKSTIDILQQTTSRAVNLMQSSSDLANRSVVDADRATLALEEISASVTLISDMATQIATAAEEQTHVTGEITQNVTSIKDVTDLLVIDSTDSLAQSHTLKEQALDLSEKVAAFKLS